MKDVKINMDEQERRLLQKYVFELEESQEKAEELAVEHEKLTHSQNLLMAALSSTIHGIYIVRSRTFVWCNKALTDILGWEQGELIGKSTEILYPSTEEYIRMGEIIYGDPRRTGLIMSEYDFVHKDGHNIPCLITGRAINEKDPSEGYVFSVTDFSERKRAQEELEKAYDEIEKRSAELIFTNEQLTREIEERKRIEKKLSEYRNHLEELVKERTADLVKANDMLIQEIEERKHTEEALRESEEKHRTILESIEEGYFEVDLAGNLTFFNNSLCIITRFSRDELVGLNNRNYTTPKTARKMYQIFNEIYRTGKPTSITDYEVIRKDGGTLVLELSVSLMRDKEGQPVGFRGVARDVTERLQAEQEKEKLEEQLRRVQKLKAIGTLSGGIAHDFNNLLMAIQGNVSLMQIKTDVAHTNYQKLQNIVDLVESGADLTRQLLGFAMGGKYEVNPANLNEILRKSSRMFGRTKKEIKLHEEYQEDLWTTEVDRGQIEQVLLNIYVNASHSMPGGGNLYLRTENVVLDEQFVRPHDVEPGRYVRISITDTGVGMDKVTRERIFEPFFTTKGMGRGTGLGLASAYGIMINHSGIISVYSEKGEGTTFNLYLPASEAEVIEEKKAEIKLLKGDETILFVDDEEFIRNVGTGLLNEMGYKVITADNGREAVEVYKARKESIDMIILDMIMPDMGGGEAYNALKEMNPDVKVLLASGYSIEGQASKILERGCDGFIQKPFNMEQLSQKIREILDNK